MTSKDKKASDDPEQSKRFIDAAKAAEADETEEGADKAFKRVAPMKHRPAPKDQNRSD